MAAANPFRFSTKYQDDETDLLYYGYRYYDPGTGRWMTRDPVEERGGQNLYVLTLNSAVGAYDLLGLLHSGQIIQIKTGADSACTARVAYYSPNPIYAFNQRSQETRVGAQIRIDLACDCSTCTGCYKWRQRFTEYEDDKRVRDNELDAEKGTEWYPEDSALPGDGCTYTFKDTPSQSPPPGMFFKSLDPVLRVVVSFQLELVKLDDCSASSGGTPVANIRWGFWYTRDANGLLNQGPK